ncbi:hypothetical protein R6Q59_009851 [Mikania micrantha]
MPLPGTANRPGKSLQCKSAALKKKLAGPPTGFTFVDQSADLRSITDKKIVNSDQRHLIRSHVMQKVRKDERLQGKKRPTGRDGPRKGESLTPADSTDDIVGTPSVDDSRHTPVNMNTGLDSPTDSVLSTSTASSRELVAIPKSPSQGRVDPFNTLPGGRDLAKLTNNLVGYCFHTFIPMTFPIVASNPTEYDGWRIKILQSQTANSATFFGMMAIVAAHQAINSGRHRDLKPTTSRESREDVLLDKDFAIMKSEALQATQARMSQNGWDGPTVEAIFSLIGAEQILGNFEEAKFHLSAVKKQFVDGQPIDPSSPASSWIPLTDVKGAIGMMTRPLFRLPWEPVPIPQETLNKLYQWHAPEIGLLGTAFDYVDGLGQQLLSILQQASALCRFCQFNAVCGCKLTAEENEIFRQKTLELEYDTLSYIYPGSPTNDKQTPDQINIVEEIARLAILGITSSIITKVHPSAGLGRAITDFQHTAIQKYFMSLKHLPSQSTARFIVWALMVFAHCASKQPEERHFINNLAWCSPWADIRDWMTLELVCTSFLYVPVYQQSHWQHIWSRVCSQQQTAPRSALLSRAQTDAHVAPAEKNTMYG